MTQNYQKSSKIGFRRPPDAILTFWSPWNAKKWSKNCTKNGSIFGPPLLQNEKEGLKMVPKTGPKIEPKMVPILGPLLYNERRAQKWHQKAIQKWYQKWFRFGFPKMQNQAPEWILFAKEMCKYGICCSAFLWAQRHKASIKNERRFGSCRVFWLSTEYP